MFRLASIENAQRETCCGAKREEFLRFARRKWLKSDRAAEHVQRLFRGYIGRRRVGLAKEVRRLTGQARAEWVEVSLRNRFVRRRTKLMLASRAAHGLLCLEHTESCNICTIKISESLPREGGVSRSLQEGNVGYSSIQSDRRERLLYHGCIR